MAAFKNDRENSEKVEEEISKENTTPKAEETDVLKGKKGKKIKAVESKEKITKEKVEPDVKSSKFTGLLKMPFKKKEKRSIDKKASDDDIDLGDDCAVLEAEELLEKEGEVKDSKEDKNVKDGVEEDTSMTEEWASFHEVHPNAVEPVGVVIKAATPKSKEKVKKAKEKKEEVEEKKKAEVGAAPSPKAVKSRKGVKNQGKKSKSEDGIKAASETSSTPATPEVEKKPKEGPLTKFFTMSSKSKISSEIPVADANIEVLSVKKVATPLRSSPRKNVSVTSPFKPTKIKSLAMAKLKGKITKLTMEMEAAVAEADFLMAHEKKLEIGKVEGEIKVLQDGGEVVAFSPPTTPKAATPMAKTPLTASFQAVTPTESSPLLDSQVCQAVPGHTEETESWTTQEEGRVRTEERSSGG